MRTTRGCSNSLTSHAQVGQDDTILGMKAISSRSHRKSLADALFTKTQQRIMRVLFGQPERSFYASRSLIRDAAAGDSHRLLAKLDNGHLVAERLALREISAIAQEGAPLYSELRRIVLKTVGLAEPLRDALKPLTSAIRAASYTVQWPRPPTNRQATSI